MFKRITIGLLILFVVAPQVFVNNASAAADLKTNYNATLEYSGVQGPIWYYEGRTDAGVIEQLQFNATSKKWFSSVDKANPVFTSTEFAPMGVDAIRRFVAPYSGKIRITAENGIWLWQEPDTAFDGVNVRIRVNDAIVIYPEGGQWQHFSQTGSASTPTPFAETLLDVKKGDSICFEVNRVSNFYADNVMWNPVIDYLNIEGDVRINYAGQRDVSYAGASLVWTSEDPSIVSVSANGLATGVGIGTTVLIGENSKLTIRITAIVSREYIEDFSSGDDYGWTHEYGNKWTVKRDGVTGGYYYYQGDSGIAISRNGLNEWKNYTVSLKLTADVLSQEYFESGIFVRYSDNMMEKSYRVTFSNSDNMLAIRGEDGVLAGYPIVFSNGDSHNIKIKLDGANIKVTLDNDAQPCIDYTDTNSPKLTGKIALMTAEATCRFSDIRVYFPVEGVAFNESNPTLFRRIDTGFKVNPIPIYATNADMLMTSSDNSVVAIENGKMIPRRDGEAVVTVTMDEGGYTTTNNISVVSEFKIKAYNIDAVTTVTLERDSNTKLKLLGDAVLVVCSYNQDGMLIQSATSEPVSMTRGSTVVLSAPINTTNLSTGCKVIAFILNKVDEIIPLAEPIIKNY